MAVLDFPSAPTLGQVFNQWQWDGVAWVLTDQYVNTTGDTMTGPLNATAIKIGSPSGTYMLNVDGSGHFEGYVDAEGGMTVLQNLDVSGPINQSPASEAYLGKVRSAGQAIFNSTVKISNSEVVRLMIDALGDVAGARVEWLKDGVTRWALYRAAGADGSLILARHNPDGSEAGHSIVIETGGGVYINGPFVAVPAPLYNLSAATKEYVDSTTVAIGGDIMTGPLQVNGNLTLAAEFPQLNLHANGAGAISFRNSAGTPLGEMSWNPGNGQFEIYGLPGRPGSAPGYKPLIRVGIDDALTFPEVSSVSTPAKITSGNFREGVGSPEGVVTAPIGTKYIDVNATNGAIEWIKATGTGNTGWKVVYGDTGQRLAVSPNQMATVFGLTAGQVTGLGITLRRQENTVTVLFSATNASGANISGANFTNALPAGFRAQNQTAFRFAMNKTNGFGVSAWFAGAGTNLYGPWTNTGNPWPNADPWAGQGSFPTDDPWPATLPGTPVF